MSSTLTISHQLTPMARTSPVLLSVPVVLLIMAAISLVTIDYPLSHYVTTHASPDEVHRALRTIEPFGSPYGMAMILLAVLVITPERLRDVGRIGAIGIAGGLCAGFVKLLVCRARPNHFEFEHNQILDSFQGVLPLMSGGGNWQSFPSAHTATAVAFAVALAHQFPRARWLCYSLAALVGLQRIEDGQHFASDVLVGAAVGWTVARSVIFIWQDIATKKREKPSRRTSSAAITSSSEYPTFSP